MDTSLIIQGGDRVGVYFNEKGASQRGSVCIYVAEVEKLASGDGSGRIQR